MSFEFFSWEPSLEDYSTRLKDKSALLEEAIAAKIDDITQRVLASIQMKLSGEVLQERTGNLFNSVYATAAQWMGTVCEGSVGIDPDSPAYVYGIAFEMGGSGYYDIFPKEKLALAFPGPEGTIFAAHVNHPPTPHRPFIEPSVEEFRAVFAAEIAETLQVVMG
jgi:hypothetical protein